MTTLSISAEPEPWAADLRRAARGFGVSLPVALLLLAIPFLLQPYRVFQLTGVLSYAVAALGLVLISGYVGQVSLSHNAFFALGAYSSALAMVNWGVGHLVSVLVAAVVCFVSGIIAGIPSRRLSGIYLVLVTLGIAVSVAPVIKHFREYTGGTAGMFVDRPESPAALDLTQDAWIYYVVALAAFVVFVLVRNLVNGSVGRALTATREVPLAAASFGVNVDVYKVLTIGIGSMLAGVGGALATFSIGFIAPDSFFLMLSIGFLAAVVVGGMRTIYGAIVAGLFLQFVPSFAADISESFAGATYGLILIVAMFVMPNGVTGSLQEWVRRRRDSAPVASHSRSRGEHISTPAPSTPSER